ncbi:MAG: hypothetical protein LKJ80_02655 [Oscillibacter sp.]|jgi:hypothetical protein|nr:hypothetical protein [Oscillibacter sp.]
MERRLFAVLLLAAMLFLSACGQRKAAYDTAASSPAEAVVSAPAESGRTGIMEAKSTVNDCKPLTEEEILLTYDRAVKAYGWFETAAMPCSGSGVKVDGTLYQRVDYPGVATLDELRDCLSELFSEPVVTRLLDSPVQPPLYIDVDGALYARPVGGRENATRGRETRTVEKLGDTAYQVNVSVEDLGEDLQTVTGVTCFSFPYELVDGHWVFTDFALVG